MADQPAGAAPYAPVPGPAVSGPSAPGVPQARGPAAGVPVPPTGRLGASPAPAVSVDPAHAAPLNPVASQPVGVHAATYSAFEPIAGQVIATHQVLPAHQASNGSGAEPALRVPSGSHAQPAPQPQPGQDRPSAAVPATGEPVRESRGPVDIPRPSGPPSAPTTRRPARGTEHSGRTSAPARGARPDAPDVIDLAALEREVDDVLESRGVPRSAWERDAGTARDTLSEVAYRRALELMRDSLLLTWQECLSVAEALDYTPTPPPSEDPQWREMIYPGSSAPRRG